jgi:hypothetical protein
MIMQKSSNEEPVDLAKKTGTSGTLCALALVVAAVTSCSGDIAKTDEGVVGSTSQALTSGVYAFAWSNQLTGTFFASSAYSTRTDIQVIRQSPGSYHVTIPTLGSVASAGNVQVTAYGGTNQYCDVGNWGGDGNNAVEINLFCTDGAGVLTDSLFTINFVSRSGTNPSGSEGGYVAVLGQGQTFGGYNSSGQAITVQHSGAGAYAVTFAGQSFSGGTAEVTTMDHQSASESQPAARCEVQSWGTSTVNVRCYTPGGTNPDGTFTPRGPLDSGFSLIFAQGLTTGSGSTALGSPNGSPSFSYVWADQPSTALNTPYTPSLTYQKGEIIAPSCCTSTTSPAVTVSRNSTGVYSVAFPQMPVNSLTRSNVKVTAYGSSGEYCKVNNWVGSNTSSTAVVKCFDGVGNAADSRYTVTFSSTTSTIP